MPLTRQQIYVRRRIVVFGSAALLLAVLFYLPFTLLAPLKSSSATVLPYEATVSEVPDLDWPTYGAAAVGAVGFDGVLGRAGSTEPLPMASITKVVTALVVLEARPLAPGEDGPTVTMTAADTALYSHYLAQNGTVSPVRTGLALTQRQLLELALVKSANNYTTSLANWAYGSTEAFVEAANAWVADHGLTGMVITEPTGIDPANVAPADTIVELGRIALEQPVVAEIVAIQSTSVPEIGVLPNTNQLLGRSGIDGIKTGTLDDHGANLLFSADWTVGEHEVTVIGVVLGGISHRVIDADILELLATVEAGFAEVELTAAGEAFASYTTVWGATADAVAAERATLLTWGGAPVTALVEVEDVRVGAAGDPVGDIVFTSGSRTVTVPLELSADLDDPGPWWRLTNPVALF